MSPTDHDFHSDLLYRGRRRSRTEFEQMRDAQRVTSQCSACGTRIYEDQLRSFMGKAYCPSCAKSGYVNLRRSQEVNTNT